MLTTIFLLSRLVKINKTGVRCLQNLKENHNIDETNQDLKSRMPGSYFKLCYPDYIAYISDINT